MSRQELAEAVNAWLFAHAGRTFGIDAAYVGKLERGIRRWPSAHYRAGFRAVLGAGTDAELGFFVIRGHASDPAPAVPGASCATGEADGLGAVAPGDPTVLVERRWQTYQAFRVQFCRVARELGTREDDPSLRVMDVSQRQFQRWMHGARPRPNACRGLEAMFGVPVARLLGPREAGDPSTLPVAEAIGGFAVPDAGGGTTVRVSVGTQEDKAITVVCPDGVAVRVGAVRVLIDPCGVDPGGISTPVADVPPLPVPAGGARVYSLAQRRAG